MLSVPPEIWSHHILPHAFDDTLEVPRLWMLNKRIYAGCKGSGLTFFRAWIDKKQTYIVHKIIQLLKQQKKPIWCLDILVTVTKVENLTETEPYVFKRIQKYEDIMNRVVCYSPSNGCVICSTEGEEYKSTASVNYDENYIVLVLSRTTGVRYYFLDGSHISCADFIWVQKDGSEQHITSFSVNNTNPKKINGACCKLTWYHRNGLLYGVNNENGAIVSSY